MLYSTDTLEELPIDEITKDPTFIERIVTEFNWETLSRQLVVNGIRVLFTLLVFFIIHLIAKWLIDKVLKNYLKKKVVEKIDKKPFFESRKIFTMRFFISF